MWRQYLTDRGFSKWTVFFVQKFAEVRNIVSVPIHFLATKPIVKQKEVDDIDKINS